MRFALRAACFCTVWQAPEPLSRKSPMRSCTQTAQVKVSKFHPNARSLKTCETTMRRAGVEKKREKEKQSKAV